MRKHFHIVTTIFLDNSTEKKKQKNKKQKTKNDTINFLRQLVIHNMDHQWCKHYSSHLSLLPH
jgi:preprotein translocase subunit SecA